MGRPKGDNVEENRKRIYLCKEGYWRLKMFTSRYGLKQQEAIDTIVFNSINDNGELYPTKINLDNNAAKTITTLSAKFNMPPNELVNWMCETIKVIFDDRLTLGDAIKPIPEIKQLLEKKD